MIGSNYCNMECPEHSAWAHAAPLAKGNNSNRSSPGVPAVDGLHAHLTDIITIEALAALLRVGTRLRLFITADLWLGAPRKCHCACGVQRTHCRSGWPRSAGRRCLLLQLLASPLPCSTNQQRFVVQQDRWRLAKESRNDTHSTALHLETKACSMNASSSQHKLRFNTTS